MTQGLFIGNRRPKSKKEVRELLAHPQARLTVSAEATSWHGNEYDGPVTDMPDGSTIVFVGPDPHRDRRFYGTITRKGDKVTVK